MTDPKTFLDEQFEAAKAEIWARGEPDCFVVLRASTTAQAPERIPIAVYGTRAGFYEEFPALRFDEGFWPVIVFWWFDDK